MADMSHSIFRLHNAYMQNHPWHVSYTFMLGLFSRGVGWQFASVYREWQFILLSFYYTSQPSVDVEYRQFKCAFELYTLTLGVVSSTH